MTEVRRTKSPIRTDGASIQHAGISQYSEEPDPHGWGSF